MGGENGNEANSASFEFKVNVGSKERLEFDPEGQVLSNNKVGHFHM